MYKCTDVNHAWDLFSTTLLKIIDDVAPMKQIRLKSRTEPWMDDTILESIRTRDQLLYDFKKDRSNADLYKQYCRVRNKIQRDIKRAKADYFSSKIDEHKNNPKKLWQQLKALGYSTKTKEQCRVVLEIDGETCFDSTKVANHINTFYTTVASNLVKKLPLTKNEFCTDSQKFKKFYADKGITECIFKLSPVTIDFVFSELCKLHPNKSTGLDNIPAKFLRDGASVLKDPITSIINLSILTNSVPDDLKCARVTPLFKKGCRSVVGNYRPISILSVISKILEKSVYSQLNQYLTDHHLLYTHQSGFRGTYSTDTCLIHLTDHVRAQVSRGNYTGMVMLDLQKAFDTVNHDILCNKLRAMGIESVDWFRSYLSGRQQIVCVNKSNSKPMPITCGVPQGSVLGPLLFLCYVNDMPISVDCKLLLYADDSALLIDGKDPKEISSKLSKELESCQQWLIDNKLSLHLGKTEAILFGSHRKLKKQCEFNVMCNNEPIQSTQSVKYLGITLDQCLSGESIANNVIKKAGARLNFLYRQALFLDPKTRKTLVSALIQCYFDYSCSSWFSGLSKKLQNKLQVMQNKIVRFILGLDSRTHVGQAELDRLEFLDTDDRVKQLKLNHAFKIFNNMSPDYLSDHFIKTSERHRYNTRDSHLNFVVPKFHGHIGSTTFQYTTVKAWNCLPSNIKSINSYANFKKEVKAHLAIKARSREGGNSRT